MASPVRLNWRERHKFDVGSLEGSTSTGQFCFNGDRAWLLSALVGDLWVIAAVNNSGDISWHKNRVFISEVFRFEELGVELIIPGLYRIFFRDMEIGELNSEELRFRAARRVV
jgi:hypothetical protein